MDTSGGPVVGMGFYANGALSSDSVIWQRVVLMQ